MGNSTSYQLKSLPTSSAISHDGGPLAKSSMDNTVRRFGEFLKLMSDSEGDNVDGITLKTLTRCICNGNASLGKCLFKQFCSINDTERETPESRKFLTVEEYIKGCVHFISLITEFDQILFFARGFSSQTDQICRSEVFELVNAAYEMAHIHHPTMCSRTANDVVQTVMHNKDTIGISYFSKWCLQHCNRLVYWMHRHLSTLLASRSSSDRVKDLPEEDEKAPAESEPQGNSPGSDSSSRGSIDEEKINYKPKRRLSKAAFMSIGTGIAMNLKRSSPKLSKKSSPSNSPHSSPKPSLTRRRRSLFPFRNSSEEDDSSESKTVEPKHQQISKSVNNVISETCAKITEQYERRTISEDQDEADADTPVLDGGNTSLLSPSVIWLLTCSLPVYYTRLGQEQKQPQKPADRKMSLPAMSFMHNIVEKHQAIHWEPLYLSERDGLGSNRFEHHTLNYRGPSIMIIKAQEDEVIFCLALDEEWKDSKNFWGGENCVLLQIRPYYRIVEKGENIMYYNQNWRGFPTGIQVGGDYESRALTVDKSFSVLQHHNMPYKVQSLEVWGCGARQIKVDQQKYKQRVVKDVEMRRKVKMTSSEWMEHPDRYLIEMAGARTSYVNN